MSIKFVTKILLGTAIALSTTAIVSQPSYACEGQEQEGNCGHEQSEPCAAEPCAAEPSEDCHSQVSEQCAPPQVQARPIFFCDDGHGIPTTFVENPRGRLPIVRWVSHYFTGSGYDPYTRCQEVSGRFQRYSDEGRLNYITTGMMNGQPVVCVSGYAGGPCDGLLFTLKRGQDASRVVQQLFDIPARASGPLYESGSRFYLDMKQYLGSL
jgi:Circadian oscillating protein COP23